ncbi:hypothetical protein MTO96_029559 [Rhipicephalus appendiculatus]
MPAPRRRRSGRPPSTPSSSDSSVTGPVATAPPARPRQPTIARGILRVYLPVPSPLRCSKRGCRAPYGGASWTSRVQSLRRHYEQEHGLRFRDRVYICSVCDATLPDRPSGHPCFRALSPEAPTSGSRHSCIRCPQSFPSARGLVNHERWHDAQDAATTGRTRGSRPAAPPVPAVLPVFPADVPAPARSPVASAMDDPRSPSPRVPVPVGPATNGPAGTASPPREATPSREPSPSSGPPGTRPVTPASAPSSPSLSGSPSPSDPDIGQVEDDTQDDPDSDATTDMPPDNTHLFSEQVRVLRAVLRESPDDQTWERCEAAWSQAVTLAVEAVRLPPASSTRTPRTINPDNAADIQRLYRRNRRRAIRLIIEGPSRSCDIPPRGPAGPLGHDLGGARGRHRAVVRAARCPPQPVDTSPFTADEVLVRLRKAENTAPGADRLTYHHWKSVDPEARFLSALFNACVHHRRTPRRLATASKLYAKCLAARLQTWVTEHHVLSHCQKGFLPYDGVFELNYIFQHRLDAARSGGPDLCAALLDFTNAYGSVPHQALFDALRGSGAGAVFTELITDLYRGNRTVIVAAEGSTEPVAIAAGLRQGCPLSGLLFNLVVDPVIRGVQGDADAHNILAYADDLTPLADCPALLQERIDLVEALATPIGLSLNPAKCSSVHMSGATPVGMRPTSFTVSGIPIQALADHQPQRFLGRPAGFRLPSRSSSVIDDAIGQARAIFSSMLAPWQRLDAVKTFVFPALNFAMRCGVLTKTDWSRLDDAVRPLIKRTLYFQPSATSSNSKRPIALAITHTF